MTCARFLLLPLSSTLVITAPFLGISSDEGPAPAPESLSWEDSPAVADLFRDAGAAGTFVLYDPREQRLTGFDEKRARKRFVPASTFKIPNSLIGLATGAVSGVDEVLPYGGEPQPYEIWERDMGLREAIRISNVPVYQELARRIGLERMRENVTALGYGNAEIGTVVDRFWLDGPLEINAVEQTLFLADLARGRLPLPASHQAAVREIARLESGGSSTGDSAPGNLHGKTGWTGPDPGLGWWVGWVEKDGRIHSFALNLDIRSEEKLGTRIDLGKACLKALGVR